MGEKETITSGFTYIAFLIFLAGMLLSLERKTKAKIFNVMPPPIWVYVLNMVFCTMELHNSEIYASTYSALKSNTLYAMTFVALLRCDFKKLSRLDGRIVTIFLGYSPVLAIGFLIGYPIFRGTLGTDTWGAVVALYASWTDGSASMVTMQAAPPVDAGAYSCAPALDTTRYSVQIALLLLVAKYAGRWNTSVKADTSMLWAVAESVNAEVAKEEKAATNVDRVFLIGLSLMISTFPQMVGKSCNATLTDAGLGMFDKGILTTVFVSVLGLICAGTSPNELPTVEELSNIYLYVVVSLLASTTSASDLLSAPTWVVYGLFTLVIYAVLVYLLSKVLHWDLCIVSTASLTDIGGSASAPIVTSAHDASYAGIGVLMGMLSAATGDFCGPGMGVLLRLFLQQQNLCDSVSYLRCPQCGHPFAVN